MKRNLLGKRIHGKECPLGHGNVRYASNKQCVQCAKLKNRSVPKAKRRVYADRFSTTVHGRATMVFASARDRAQKKGEEILVTVDWIEERIARGHCEVSGIPFSLKRSKRTNPYSPSLDRIDNSKGYSPENCRVILWALNVAFNHWGEDTFKAICLVWLSKFLSVE